METTTPTAGRPSIPPEQRRTQGINLKVSPEEKEMIQELTASNGTSQVEAIINACKLALEQTDDPSVLSRIHKLENRVGAIEELLPELPTQRAAATRR